MDIGITKISIFQFCFSEQIFSHFKDYISDDLSSFLWIGCFTIFTNEKLYHIIYRSCHTI